MSKKILIVGGVAGGASVAAKLRRLDETANIIMFERGEYISYANCGLPYYIGGVIADRDDLLVRTPKSLYNRFNIDIRVNSEVVNIFPKEKEVEVYDIKTQRVYRENYDYLVLSPGAKPIVPPISGTKTPNVFTVRTVPDSDRIKDFVNKEKPQKALVIGGGFIGLEMAENLRKKGLKVEIVEAAEQIMAPLDYEMAALLHSYLKTNGIGLRLNSKVISFEGDVKVEKAVLDNIDTLDVDMVVMCVGVVPENDLAKKAGLETGLTGGIIVDKQMKTSDDNIYAVGDAVQIRHFVTGQDVLVPLAAPASKQARIAAENIAGRFAEYNGVQGTAIAKILNMTVATTGVNEKTLKKLGTEYLTCYLHPYSNATYYPETESIAIKLIFTPGEGRILGAQMFGSKGVDKRIDVIAAAIRGGMTVYDLQEVEFAYAPPFSSAKDPINMAGYVAANILNGDNPVLNWHEVNAIDFDKAILLDVRDEDDYEEGHIPLSINIPLEQLRRRFHELAKDKDIIIYCREGIKAYIAVRFLQQQGFSNVKNLNGGILTVAPLYT